MHSSFDTPTSVLSSSVAFVLLLFQLLARRFHQTVTLLFSLLYSAHIPSFHVNTTCTISYFLLSVDTLSAAHIAFSCRTVVILVSSMIITQASASLEHKGPCGTRTSENLISQGASICAVRQLGPSVHIYQDILSPPFLQK